MTTKEQLHQIVDELSEREADEALRYLVERQTDPLVAAFAAAPADDEPLTEEDERALAEVAADRTASEPRVSLEQFLRGA